MTRLELAQAVHKILKTGPGTPGTQPTSTTVNTDPDLIDIVDSVDRAWRHIQSLSAHWEWRNRRELITLWAGSNVFDLGQWYEVTLTSMNLTSVSLGEVVYVRRSLNPVGSARLVKIDDDKVHLFLTGVAAADISANDFLSLAGDGSTNNGVIVSLKPVFEEFRFADNSASPFIEMLRQDAVVVSRVYYDNLGSMRYFQNFDWNLEGESTLTFPSGSPTQYSIDEDGKSIAFNYDLDVNHQVILHIRAPTTALLADGDSPDMPTRHDDVIIYKACALWASAEEHTKKRSMFLSEYRNSLRQLRNDQLPPMTLNDDVVS